MTRSQYKLLLRRQFLFDALRFSPVMLIMILSVRSLMNRLFGVEIAPFELSAIIEIALGSAFLVLVILLLNYYLQTKQLMKHFDQLQENWDTEIFYLQYARWLPNGSPSIDEWLLRRFPSGQLVLTSQGLFYISRAYSGVAEETISFGHPHKIETIRKFPFSVVMVETEERPREKCYFMGNSFRGLNALVSQQANDLRQLKDKA